MNKLLKFISESSIPSALRSCISTFQSNNKLRRIKKIFFMYHLMINHQYNPIYKSQYLIINNLILHLPDKYSYGVYKEIFEDKIYDLHLGVKNPIIVDLGSNIGISIIRLKQLNPGATIIGFEPNSSLIPILWENIIHNIDTKNIVIYEYAVIGDTTPNKFLIQKKFSAGGSFYEQNVFTANSSLPVKTIHIKQVLMHFKEIHLIKIDIEGTEKDIVPYILKYASRIHNIIIEIHNLPAINPYIILSQLSEKYRVVINNPYPQNYGYALQGKLPNNQYGYHPIVAYCQSLEI